MVDKSDIYQLLISKTKEEIIKEYKKFDKVCSSEFHHYLSIELNKTIHEDNIANLKKLTSIINSTREYKGTITQIILSCKYNRINILNYLLSCNVGGKILPSDKDESGLNAFYYAISSGNIELLDTLINKWPNDYFTINPENLDKLLAKAYEQLKLKRVPLLEEMEYFVETKLINLRFFSKGQNNKTNIDKTKERIGLILENINLLKAKKVDDTFLFIVTFIAQNIHVLKRQLKSTYDKIPWEEMEFCLVSFVSSHIKQQEINMFYLATINKSKIMEHLENFANKLKQEMELIGFMNINKLAILPNLDREVVVVNIINDYPQFKELYNDYKEIRDVHSLEKIYNCVKLALSVDHKEKEGQIVITRVLQVTGEYLKNTLESPKLSNSTSELLLLTLPKNTRQIITNLRDSLSHAYSLSTRTEIYETTDIDFFIRVQNDIKKIYNVISDILFNKKIKTVIMLLERFTNSESLDEIAEVCEIVNKIRFIDLLQTVKLSTPNFVMMEHKKLEKLIKELIDITTEKTLYEKMLFNQINDIINSIKTEENDMNIHYFNGLTFLVSITSSFCNVKIGNNVIRDVKFRINRILKDLGQNVEARKLKEIAEVVLKVSNSLKLRMKHSDSFDLVNRLILEIFLIAEFSTDNLERIDELKEKLREKTRIMNKKSLCSVPQEKYNDQLNLKLSELKSILRKNSLDGKALLCYKNDKKLQAVIEMLVLDTLSILDTSKNIVENICFLDDNTSLLTGKNLRNHLAHDNVLLDISLFDPLKAIIINAQTLVDETITINKNGKLVKDEHVNLRERYNELIDVVSKQEIMFAALEKGNFESLKDCLKIGTDIRARSLNLWTTLHFAAKGSNLEIIKFIVSQNLNPNEKDINGQNPLHIAAAHGNEKVVEYFLKEVGLGIDDLDYLKKTPLHLAAQIGHKDTVKILLKYKSNFNIRDLLGFAPLHIAISNNHIDAVKILMEKEINVDNNEIAGGYNSLHLAAEKGHLELVNFLLRNKANVNARTDEDYTPLHAAAFNGHLDVVHALISRGVNINATVLNGCTPLHYAAENCHREIITVLLKHGANVNAIDKTFNNTSLHYIAKSGNEEIFKILLNHQADASVATVEGMTPLHFAAQQGNLKIITVLLKHNVDVNYKNILNVTPLHFAAEEGHKEVAEFLIKNKAEINTKTVYNLTPLHLAALKGHKDVIDLLLKSKAEVTARDLNGNTPLHSAAMNGSNIIIDLLIKNKAEVNCKNNIGKTPLHIAAENGHMDIIIFLIQNKANVHVTCNSGYTPLCIAIMEGNSDIVNILIKHQVQVNVKDGNTVPLLVAVEAGYKNIVQILLMNGADVNIERNDITPLVSAIKHNHTEIVEVLISNGANVNVDGNKALIMAILCGYGGIVDILIKNHANVNARDHANITPLHVAAERGHNSIVNALIVKGADIDAKLSNNATPLYLAAQKGNKEIVEMLVAGGANVNIKCCDSFTPLHIAAQCGHSSIVRVLLDNDANINVTNKHNRTPVELAVAHGHTQVVKIILEYNAVNKINNDWTILHIASQQQNLEMVKYLVDEGYDINAITASGSKPIHIAAGEGFKDIVDFFLSKKMDINETNASNQTLLHCAGMYGHVDVVNYLIAQGADINAKDNKGLTPMHIATNFGHLNVVKVLLNNTAVYNSVDVLSRSPLDIVQNQAIKKLLTTTDNLFKAVKHNSPTEVENCIKTEGVFVNAKNADGVTPLHYAAWKGYDKIADILLRNKANPNTVGNNGSTPLHYASKFGHLSIVKALLSNGAVYNLISEGGKTPLDFTNDKNIVKLLKLVNESFKSIKNGNVQIVNNLNKIKDIDTIKAIMRTRNRDNKTLIVAAMLSNFSKIKELKDISQGDVTSQIIVGSMLLQKEDSQLALNIFTKVFEKRKEIFGLDNPATLDIQIKIAKVIYSQGAYQDCLNLLKDTFQKLKEILGLNHRDTLKTRSFLALVLHRLGKDEDALTIFQEVYQEQKKMLGTNHSDTLDTQFHMALSLDKLGKYEEALVFNNAVFKRRQKLFGTNDSTVIRARNNIAMILGNQGKFEESIQIYKEVLEQKKQILGIHHSDTLRTSCNIANLLIYQHKYPEAMNIYEEVLSTQKMVLGADHSQTLISEYSIANALFAQGKLVSSLKAFRKCLDRIKAVLGPDHPVVSDSLIKIKTINQVLNYKDTDESEIFQHLQQEINIAASNGDVDSIQRLLKSGVDINDTDVDGRTPLHFAISSGKISVVNLLLNNGANATKITNKGNTPLHTATSKGYKEIVEMLLRHVNRDELNKFINAKTTGSGTTSLHVAVKSNFFDITKTLLKLGATYDIKNNDGKTPRDLSGNQSVTKLLNLIDDLFKDAKNGNLAMLDKLAAIQPDEFAAVTNARNNQGNVLLQVAIFNKHKILARKLSEILKNKI